MKGGYMRHWKLFLIMILIGLLMVSCGNRESENTGTSTENQSTSTLTTEDVEEETVAPSETAEDEVATDEPVEVASDIEVIQSEVDECLECHTDKDKLIETTSMEEEMESESTGPGCGGEVAPLEPWEKVLVDGETYPNSIHGLNKCTECHSGVQSAEKEIAHTGLISNPSDDVEGVCGRCHENITNHADINLHNTLQGYWTVLEARGISESDPATQEMFSNHCSECHTSCGQCHVSQPEAVGGGLIDGHNFLRVPSMTRNCTACHGSRVGNEYLGKNEGVLADVHFRQGSMVCTDCHSGNEMHGTPYECTSCHDGPVDADPPPPDHRYSGVELPSCESCHPNVATGDDDILMHDYHGGSLSCQVCHSTSYTNCDGCHVAVSEKTGNPFYNVDNSYLGFFIGRNPNITYDRPYEYVTLRHVPIAADNFSFYGINLPKFSQLETWKYATPHNIQRITPQAESCNSCHGNSEIFLTADKVSPDELDANLNVIMDQVPPAIQSRDQFIP